MIDFIRGRVCDLKMFTDSIISSDKRYSLKQVHNGRRESHELPLHSNVENIHLKITEKQGIIENSLHTYWNIINTEGNQNYNDFSFCDIKFALEDLEKSLNYNLDNTTLTSLEFGFNIKVGKSPTELIEENILMYNFKPPCLNPQNIKFKKIKKFEYENYIIKIYDKSLQYNLINKSILRIEIKYKNNSTLNKFEINSCADLKNINIYYLLIKDFLKKIENLLIVDSYKGNERMSIEEQNLLTKYTHPNFWDDLKKKRTKHIKEVWCIEKRRSVIN